jgi:hypothetical protein
VSLGLADLVSLAKLLWALCKNSARSAHVSFARKAFYGPTPSRHANPD